MRSGGLDLVESSQALKPIAALEIKWSDRYVDQPEALKGLLKFAHINELPHVWATTRSRFGRSTIGESEIRQWPAAVLAFHYGTRPVRGRIALYEANIKGIDA